MKSSNFNFQKSPINFLLIGMSIFCFALSVARTLISGKHFYLYLNWNLFLSFVPWVLSLILVNSKLSRKYGLFRWFMFLLWLVFFPNTVYILTDLFHLRWESSFPIWFDFVLITSFAWTGFLYGFVSLLNIERFLVNYCSRKILNIIIAFLLFLSSFGVYLGRVLRWNSWDIVMQPLPLFVDIKDRISDPFGHPGTWGMTILLGILLNMMFWSVKFLMRKDLLLTHKPQMSNEC